MIYQDNRHLIESDHKIQWNSSLYIPDGDVKAYHVNFYANEDLKGIGWPKIRLQNCNRAPNIHETIFRTIVASLQAVFSPVNWILSTSDTQ